MNKTEVLETLNKIQKAGWFSEEYCKELTEKVIQEQIKQKAELRQNLLDQLELTLLAIRDGIVTEKWAKDLIAARLDDTQPFFGERRYII